MPRLWCDDDPRPVRLEMSAVWEHAMIYQAVGYKRLRDSTGASYLHRTRSGKRTTYQNVAMAEADHLSQRYPDLIWNVETIGASQQVWR